MKASSLTIKLDPGHGGTDPGVVDTGRGVLEKDANLATVLTLKYLLEQQGIKVVLSRKTDVKPSYPDRVKAEGQQALIAVHYNMMKSYPCIYYQQGALPRSLALANTISMLCKIPDAKVWSTATESRWGRLYIDDSKTNAVLWEVDCIDRYEDSRAYRMERCMPVVRAIKAFYEVK